MCVRFGIRGFRIGGWGLDDGVDLLPIKSTLGTNLFQMLLTRPSAHPSPLPHPHATTHTLFNLWTLKPSQTWHSSYGCRFCHWVAFLKVIICKSTFYHLTGGRGSWIVSCTITARQTTDMMAFPIPRRQNRTMYTLDITGTDPKLEHVLWVVWKKGRWRGWYFEHVLGFFIYYGTSLHCWINVTGTCYANTRGKRVEVRDEGYKPDHL